MTARPFICSSRVLDSTSRAGSPAQGFQDLRGVRPSLGSAADTTHCELTGQALHAPGRVYCCKPGSGGGQRTFAGRSSRHLVRCRCEGRDCACPRLQESWFCAGRSSRDEPKAAGLGYASSPPRSQGGEADPYDSYRRQRADTYHELLGRDRTREEAPSTGGRRRKSRFDV